MKLHVARLNDIPTFNFYQVDIWKPDIALKNSFVDYKELGVDTLNVELYADGTVFWYPFQVGYIWYQVRYN